MSWWQVIIIVLAFGVVPLAAFLAGLWLAFRCWRVR